MNPAGSLSCRTCRTCRGPVQDGFARCYQCDLAASQAGGLLADVVVPIGYAVKGRQLAADLWHYKSGRGSAAAAAGRGWRGVLPACLRARGGALGRAAGMPDGPAAAAVAPSGQGRPGAHPLVGIVKSCVALPMARLVVDPRRAARGRGVSLGW